jgi:hypothetical protein
MCSPKFMPDRPPGDWQPCHFDVSWQGPRRLWAKHAVRSFAGNPKGAIRPVSNAMAKGQRAALESFLDDRGILDNLRFTGAVNGWHTYELIVPLLPHGVKCKLEMLDQSVWKTNFHGTPMYAQSSILLQKQIRTTVKDDGNAARGTGVYVTEQIETGRGFSPGCQPFGNNCYIKVVFELQCRLSAQLHYKMRPSGWSEETYNKEDVCITKVHYGMNRPPVLANEGCCTVWEPDLEILPIGTKRE